MCRRLDQGEGYISCVGGFTSINVRLVSFGKTRSKLKYLLVFLNIFGWEISSLYTCNTAILSYVVSITSYISSAISKNTAADYQSISQHDIICTGINCAMIQYNS